MLLYLKKIQNFVLFPYTKYQTYRKKIKLIIKQKKQKLEEEKKSKILYNNILDNYWNILYHVCILIDGEYYEEALEFKEHITETNEILKPIIESHSIYKIVVDIYNAIDKLFLGILSEMKYKKHGIEKTKNFLTTIKSNNKLSDEAILKLDLLDENIFFFTPHEFSYHIKNILYQDGVEVNALTIYGIEDYITYRTKNIFEVEEKYIKNIEHLIKKHKIFEIVQLNDNDKIPKKIQNKKDYIKINNKISNDFSVRRINSLKLITHDIYLPSINVSKIIKKNNCIKEIYDIISSIEYKFDNYIEYYDSYNGHIMKFFIENNFNIVCRLNFHASTYLENTNIIISYVYKGKKKEIIHNIDSKSTDIKIKQMIYDNLNDVPDGYYPKELILNLNDFKKLQQRGSNIKVINHPKTKDWTSY